MKREETCTGHTGYGVFCAKCGNWSGSVDSPTITIPQKCFDCKNKEFTVISRYSCIIVRTLGDW